ncbi:hypothetical protein R9X50_00549400 [Acrodontium crateriforme]|uniref:glutathione-specific gamma-glutamylcyclotransferase n=1 Tax=Acrodontium crateriforme TaxID=150365 RepID=A0AAQ3M6M4_9PEZI|nr:hypothetical protein R9X50_00549400 [Acrodontium crateriforme]
MANDSGETDLWLFGYGSLIWKPPPHYDLRVPGYIEGYVRRFWQASEDHRGTPEAPGRVVTLIAREHWETLTDHHASAPPKVWGAAYRIPSTHVAEVKEYLDIREINGYSIQYTPFTPANQSTLPTLSSKPSNGNPISQGLITHPPPHPSPSSSSSSSPPSAQINCLVYIGLPNNPQFLGPQNPQLLAEHIAQSQGPSGLNSEYLYQLEKALDALSEESGDEHVWDLARRCREVERGEKGKVEKGEVERNGV